MTRLLHKANFDSELELELAETAANSIFSVQKNTTKFINESTIMTSPFRLTVPAKKTLAGKIFGYAPQKTSDLSYYY